MKVVLKVLAICSFMLLAKEASAGVIIGGNRLDLDVGSGSGEIVNEIVNTPDIYYDAIFNSTILSMFANPNTIITLDNQTRFCLSTNLEGNMDNVTQDCLNAYAVNNVQLLLAGGVGLRSCMNVTDYDLSAYFIRSDSYRMYGYFTNKMAHCVTKSSTQKVMNCNAETIAVSLGKVKSAVEPNYKEIKNKTCLLLELENMSVATETATSQLMTCLPQNNPCVTVAQTTVNPSNNSTNANTTISWATTSLPVNTTVQMTTLPPYINTTTAATTVNATTPTWTTPTTTTSLPWGNTTVANNTNTNSVIVVNTPDIYYDAIFNSTVLNTFANENSIITLDNATSICLSTNDMDNVSQDCLNTYAVSNVQLLFTGGAALRSCMNVTDDDLNAYFAIPDSTRMYAYFTGEMAHCITKSSTKLVMDCNSETIAVSLGKVKSAVTPNYKVKKNKTCISLELTSMLNATQAATDQLMDCLPQSNPCNVATQNPALPGNNISMWTSLKNKIEHIF